MENKDYNVGIDKTLVCSGDSLTAGSGGTAISFLLQQRLLSVVHNEAIGGQTTAQIAARMGANQLYVTLSGNTTNASTKVSITSISNQLLSTNADTTIRAISGTLMVGAGVQCVIERTVVSNIETYTLQPVISQTITVPPNTLFIPDQQNNYKSAINIIWWGRNDTLNFSSTKKYIDNYIGNLKSLKRFFILGILPAFNETIGTSNNNAISLINSQLLSEYTDNYIESTPPTIEEMSELGYTPISQDLIEIATGVFPSTMRVDNVHLNTLGYSVFALRVYKKLKNIL